ncbi:MAG: ROK family protein [Bacteroidota bacterium]
MFGGIEAGGTKFVCAVGNGPDDLHEIVRFPTTTPEETIGRTLDFFKKYNDSLAAIGIASFGPVDPNPLSPTYGYITSTPKPGWANTDLAGEIHKVLNQPFVFDTDVNGAALGEYKWGAARDVDSALYLTVGTGVGGGAIVNGQRLHGLLHPEMGHLMLPTAPGDTFAGNCPYHKTCLEGMATGPALKKRWGTAAENLPPDHEAWDIEAWYLAMAVVNYILTLSPHLVIMGGGVMEQEQLFPKIRRIVQETLNGYIAKAAITADINAYIVPPALGNQAGVLGSIALAQEAI